MSDARLDALERRVAALEERLTLTRAALDAARGDFVERPSYIGDEEAEARDHGGTEAGSMSARQAADQAPCQAPAPPDGAASVQPSPAFPSERAKVAAYAAANRGHVFDGLRAAYAVDRPAIEAAASEREVRAFAAWLTDPHNLGWAFPLPTVADRYLAARKGER